MRAAILLLVAIGVSTVSISARAGCSDGFLRVLSRSPDVTLEWNGSDILVHNLQLQYQAYTHNVGGNCKVVAHFTGSSAIGSGETNDSGDGIYGFGEAFIGLPEPGSAVNYPGSLYLIYPILLDVNVSSIGSVSSFPQVGTIDFYYAQSEGCYVLGTFADFVADTSCGSTNPPPGVDSNYLASINVHLNMAPWIPAMPVLFN